jgi:CelD/BcsL family acetyltransferase involved in cellulose biosynthesis
VSGNLRRHQQPHYRFNPVSLRYEVVTDLAAAERIVPAWNELLDRSICNRAFSSPIWFLAACQVQPELTPWLALVWRDECLAGVLPLAVRPETQEAVFPNSMSNYNDLIVANGDVAAAAGLFEFALSERVHFRRLDLKWVRQDSNLAAALHVLSGRRELAGCYLSDRDYFYIALSPTPAEYLASRSRVFRKGVNRILRRAAAEGLTMNELTPADLPPARLVELFLSLHFSRFGEKSAFRPGLPNTPFVELALPILFAERQLHAFAVSKEDNILALDLSFRGARGLCTWNGGYSPSAECWSPGRLLLLSGIQRASQLGLEEYDLLRGNQEWKASWANRSRTVGRIVLEL